MTVAAKAATNIIVIIDTEMDVRRISIPFHVERN
jgi:hypothetical protein